MDEKEMLTNSEDMNNKMPKLELIGTLGSGEDDTIVIPLEDYKYLVRCEAVIELMDKALDKHGEYSYEPAKLMGLALKMLRKEDSGKEGSEDAE